MAQHDVRVNEIDVIKIYNRKFGDFSVSFCGHMHDFRHGMREKLEEFQKVKQDIKRKRERIENEIRDARRKCEDSYNCGSWEIYNYPDGSCERVFEPDHDYIRQCREEYNQLKGPVYNNAQNCEELAHRRLMQATNIVSTIEQRINEIVSSFQNYVERGRMYLDKVEQYIEQYKEANPNS